MTPAFLLDKRSGSVTPMQVHLQSSNEALLSLDKNDTARIALPGTFSPAGSKVRAPVLIVAANRNNLIPPIKSQINPRVKNISLRDACFQTSPFFTLLLSRQIW